MAIETPLINLYKILDSIITTDEMRKTYQWWGRKVMYRRAMCCVRYGKDGKILSVTDFGKYEIADGTKTKKDKKTGERIVEVKTKLDYAEEVIPVWGYTRTGKNVKPFPFSDRIDYHCKPDFVNVCSLARKAVFGDMPLPPCVEDWFKAIPNVPAAIEEFKKNNKVNTSSFIKFVYEDDVETSLTARPEVRELMAANEYELCYKWAREMPKLSKKDNKDDKPKKKTKKKVKDADDGEEYYDVVDDKPLKLSDVYLLHSAVMIGGELKIPVSFNIEENNKGQSDCRNYPMSKKHGEMMDAALSWLYRPSKPISYCGANATKDELVRFKREMRSANYTRFSHDGHNYLWFPVLTKDSNIEVMDKLVDKFQKMNLVLRKLVEGVINPKLTFDEHGYLEDSSKNRDLIPWLTDDEIYLYEVSFSGNRMMMVERPFSVEKLIKCVHDYNTKMVSSQIDAENAPVKYASYMKPNEDGKKLTDAMSNMVAHVCDEKFVNWSDSTTALRLWKDYLYNHIYQGRPSSKELLRKIRQKLVYSMEKYLSFDKKELTDGFNRTAMLTELAASVGVDDLNEDMAFNAGRIMAHLSYSQFKNNLPMSFAKSILYAVYNGAIDLKAEIEKFITLSPQIKGARRAEYARYVNQANKLKERGKALGVNLGWENILNSMNVDISKFYRSNAKSSFGVALSAITTTLGKKARNVVDADANDKTDFGKFIGYLHNRSKEIGDACRIVSDDDKTKFILGFYTYGQLREPNGEQKMQEVRGN